MQISKCRLCHGQLSEPVLSFPDTPLANEFLKVKTVQETFPLQICCCSECGHYQLNEQVEPERMFRHYLFVSGTSSVNVEHFRQYAVNMDKMVFKGSARPKVLDIASNDGTLLRHFKNLGYDVLGIDPAINLAEEATKSGIPTLPEFFTEENADKIAHKHGRYDLITANNVFAHVPDMIGFTKGVKKLLAPYGIYTFEVSYFGDVVEKLLFDTIYHEHTSYHTIQPLIKFFKSHGLMLFKVDEIDTHGGSLRAYVCHDNDLMRTALESAFNLRYLNFYHFRERENNIAKNVSRMRRSIRKLGNRLREKIDIFKLDKKSIAVYGTPAKATTLTYALDLDPNKIDFAVDDAPLKQGRFTPGKHIPIFHPDAIYERKPDVVLILAWNFADSIMKNHSQFKGTWIVPLPELKEYKSL